MAVKENINAILSIVERFVDINCGGSIFDDGEDVSHPWWNVGKALCWDYDGVVEGHGQPEVKRVVRHNSQRDESPAYKSKISAGATKVPSCSGIASPHSLHNPRSKSFCAEH